MKPSVFIYGAGRVGLAVASLARVRGVEVRGLWNSRPLRPERAALAESLPLSIGEDPPAGEADLWLVAVPDDAIVPLSERLAETSGAEPRAVAHTAGAHPASLLEPLVARGIPSGSWHPAMTFRGADDDSAALARATIALEGAPMALEVLGAFTRALGLDPVVLAADRKPHYHAALVIASNGRMALDAAAADLLGETGLDAEAARSLLAPLVQRTEDNLRALRPRDALTGPVVRGDARTVAADLEALRDRPLLHRLYRAIGEVALELVPSEVRGPGHAEVADRIRTMLR
ncbi:MAG TPA: Rossmann-like and DUF2520 domain-containing protein [Gemmatimonadota bacterium]|nr:Rossmann-like and DUF2520 domain-containing protein [Gemmatimonadota bacterium]